MASYLQLLYYLVIRIYIRNQLERYKKKSFEDEYRSLIQMAGINIDERYFP